MIQGSTELVAIVGSPIAQVKSPENFNRWFASHQQNVAMLAIDLAPSALQNFVQTLRGWQNMRGCVVTVLTNNSWPIAWTASATLGGTALGQCDPPRGRRSAGGRYRRRRRLSTPRASTVSILKANRPW
jgi:hypothetical protein